MFVCLYVRKEQLGSHWTDIHEIWYLSIFGEFVWKIQGYIHELGICNNYRFLDENSGFREGTSLLRLYVGGTLSVLLYVKLSVLLTIAYKYI